MINSHMYNIIRNHFMFILSMNCIHDQDLNKMRIFKSAYFPYILQFLSKGKSHYIFTTYMLQIMPFLTVYLMKLRVYTTYQILCVGKIILFMTVRYLQISYTIYILLFYLNSYYNGKWKKMVIMKKFSIVIVLLSSQRLLEHISIRKC